MSPTPPPRCPLADPPRAVSVRTFLENQEGRGAIVLCTAQSHPPSRLSLHHRGQLLATSLSPAVTSGLRAVPSHNALRLELVALGTATGGRYVCVATNTLGNATGSADLDVHSEWGRTLQRIVGIPQKIFPRKWEMEQEGESWGRRRVGVKGLNVRVVVLGTAPVGGGVAFRTGDSGSDCPHL